MDELRSSPTISVEACAQVMGIGRSLAYDLAREGSIPVIRLGRRLRVPSAAVLRMLDADSGTPND
nr:MULTISPECIES: excisionase family DNA-binding protein [unclassified Mycobacterium]